MSGDFFNGHPEDGEPDMNDKELADKVVALGVPDGFNLIETGRAKYFVRDWRVAGALLTMVYDAYANIDDMVQTFEGDPRAIIEACVEALT